MARFRGEHEETFTVDAPLEKAKAHFANLETIGTNYGGLQRYEKLDDKTLRFILKPVSALGVSFAGRYDCRYDFTSDSVMEWHDVGQGDCMFSRGRVEFVSLAPNKTRITYRDSIELEIEVNRFVAKALAPLVVRDIQSGVKGYLDRMRRSL